MPTFEIPVFWEECGDVIVKADTLEDAVEIAKELTPPFEKAQYVDNSYTVNEDLVSMMPADYFIADK